MEDRNPAVDLRQDGAVRPVRGVHKTRNCALRPETLRNVLNDSVRGCIVLMALWDVKALKGSIKKRVIKTCMGIVHCEVVSCSTPLDRRPASPRRATIAPPFLRS